MSETIKIRILQNVNTIIIPALGRDFTTQRTQLLDSGERLGPDYVVELHAEPFPELPREDQEKIARKAEFKRTTLFAARQAVGSGRAEVISGELPAFPYKPEKKAIKQESGKADAEPEDQPAPRKRKTRKAKGKT